MSVSEQPVAAVSTRGLTRVFDATPPVEALVDCTFDVRPGEFVAITGPSGSGKSTLLSLLGLLDEPTSGQYLLNGTDVSHLNEVERAVVRANRLGFVFQAFHLIEYRTVLDNVEIGLLYQGGSRRERRRRAARVVDQVGLAHRQDTLCSVLSGGEKQRVAIARALVREPTVVLCDEPTGNLDTATSDGVLELLERLNADGVTLIVITHDPSVAARAQRELVMRDGRLSEPQRELT